jgi:hypothetical protein
MRMPGTTDSRSLTWKSYGSYFAFLGAAFLALYTQIAVVRPIHESWHEVTMDAFGFQHRMAQNEHERLARKFHMLATFDQIQGYQARVHAAHEIADSQNDYQNATAMYERARLAYEQIKDTEQDAVIHGERAYEEQALYLDYLYEASQSEQRAEKLQAKANNLVNQSEYYHKRADELDAIVKQDTELENSYYRNATEEGLLADDVSGAEKEKEDDTWICKWSVARKLFCGPLGGMTALGEVDALRQQQSNDYQTAIGLQNQIMVEKTEMMIALTKASMEEETARLDYLKAEQSHNASLTDQLNARHQHAMELEDLLAELEDMKQLQKELHDLDYYQGLEIQLAVQARKENYYAHVHWELGTHFLHQAETEEERSKTEYDLAEKESAIQAELVRKAATEGRQLRLYSSIGAAYALVAVVLFVMALVTTNTISMAHQLKLVFVAVNMTVVRPLNGRHTTWEDRSILGDYQYRNCLRQISVWCHHGLIFMFVVGMQGGYLHSIFDLDSFLMRGEIVMRFALASSVIETMLFQALPRAAVLPALTREYFRDVAIRFVASALRFAFQMMLFLVLCGEGSTWLFGWIAFLNATFLFWALLLISTTLAHMWYIEFPYAWDLDRNTGPLSDMTITTFGPVSIDVDSSGSVATEYFWSQLKRIRDGEAGKKATVAMLPRDDIASRETESLLTVSPTDAPANSVGSPMVTVPYSSIPFTASSKAPSNYPALLPSPALQRLYEVSIMDSFFETLAYVEALLLVGVLIVIGSSLQNIAHH